MLYFHAITQGILFGITLAFMAGPGFFSLIQTSISKGFKIGSQLAMGISLSDIIMVFIAWFGLSTLFETQNAQKILSASGGFVLCIFGIYTALKKHITHPNTPNLDPKNKFHFKYFVKGFIFNIANPSIWIYWLIPVGVASSLPNVKLQIIFLVSILITVFCMDILKCAIANELKRFMTDKVITFINRVVGGILIVFGIYLICSLFIDNDIIPSIPQHQISPIIKQSSM